MSNCNYRNIFLYTINYNFNYKIVYMLVVAISIGSKFTVTLAVRLYYRTQKLVRSSYACKVTSITIYTVFKAALIVIIDS